MHSHDDTRCPACGRAALSWSTKATEVPYRDRRGADRSAKARIRSARCRSCGIQVRPAEAVSAGHAAICRACGLLAPEVREQIVGTAQVRDVFRSSKFGVVAGCLVIEGSVKRNNPIRVLRDNVVIFEGALESLRRFKDDVGEVRAGTECGIGVKNYQDVRVGDQIECYARVEVARAIA